MNTRTHRHTTKWLRELQRRLRTLGDEEHNAEISKCEGVGAVLLEVRASLVVRERGIVLLDTGALYTFMVLRFVAAHNIATEAMGRPLRVKVANGAIMKVESMTRRPTIKFGDSLNRS